MRLGKKCSPHASQRDTITFGIAAGSSGIVKYPALIGTRGRSDSLIRGRTVPRRRREIQPSAHHGNRLLGHRRLELVAREGLAAIREGLVEGELVAQMGRLLARLRRGEGSGLAR